MSRTTGRETESRPALPRPCLVLITDGARSVLPLLEAAEEAVAAGVDAVQLREAGLSLVDLLTLARRLRAITAGRALLLINSDASLALEVGADGVHLPEHSASLAEVRAMGGEQVRAMGGERLLVGRSVHGVEAARRAAAEGADYIQAGAVFATASHPGRAPGGLALVQDVRAAVGLPLVAVGGITPENADAVLAAGADGVAVIGAVLGSERPGAAVRRLREALGGGR